MLYNRIRLTVTIIISFLSKMSISYIEKITNFFTKYVSTDGVETLKDKNSIISLISPKKTLSKPHTNMSSDNYSLVENSQIL